jgi:hypothetical protein
MSSVRSTRVAAAVASVAALGLAAAAAGAQAPPDTTISVSPRVLIAAPQKSPVDFPGVGTARAGQPLPKGYVAVARDVKISRGAEVAFAAMRMTCPKGKTWRTGASAGDVAMSVLDRRVSGKRSVLVLASASTTVAQGATASGTVYSLCR